MLLYIFLVCFISGYAEIVNAQCKAKPNSSQLHPLALVDGYGSLKTFGYVTSSVDACGGIFCNAVELKRHVKSTNANDTCVTTGLPVCPPTYEKPEKSLVCSPVANGCGATIPLYRYGKKPATVDFFAADRFEHRAYGTVAIAPNGYELEWFFPLCYIWSADLVAVPQTENCQNATHTGIKTPLYMEPAEHKFHLGNGTSTSENLGIIAKNKSGCEGCLTHYAVYQGFVGNEKIYDIGKQQAGFAQMANGDFFCASKAGDCGMTQALYKHTGFIDDHLSLSPNPPAGYLRGSPMCYTWSAVTTSTTKAQTTASSWSISTSAITSSPNNQEEPKETTSSQPTSTLPSTSSTARCMYEHLLWGTSEHTERLIPLFKQLNWKLEQLKHLQALHQQLTERLTEASNSQQRRHSGALMTEGLHMEALYERLLQTSYKMLQLSRNPCTTTEADVEGLKEKLEREANILEQQNARLRLIETELELEGRKEMCDCYEPYRSPNGVCNNRMKGYEKYGAAFQLQTRLKSANYEDAIGMEPRSTGSDGKTPLPSARTVSLAIFQNADTRARLPNFFFQWGQYITHDIVLTPIQKDKFGVKLNCTTCDSTTTESDQCFPIPVQGEPCESCSDDPRNNQCPRVPKGCEPIFKSGSCLRFVRSVSAQQGSDIGVRAQQNDLTAFIDASSVYGSTMEMQTKLRVSGPNAGGRLKLQQNGLPPRDPNNQDCTGDDKGACFLMGDKRNSITMGLASMHIMWVYEHNRIVDELARINAQWDSDRLFQEGRGIVAAMHQHINYKEYLPGILGPKIMDKYQLNPRSSGFTDDYDSACDPGIFTEFATAALRFGHSQSTSIFWKGYKREGGIWDLKENFFNPAHLYADPTKNWRNLLIGLQYQQCKKSDNNFDWILQHRLLTKANHPMSGVDLPALNIQRGRDHGLQFYRVYRQHYRLFVPTEWNDLSCCMTVKAIESLKSVYDSVRDIELFSGMMLERPLENAEVGELTAHMLADQFFRLKRCDRFWYESRAAPSSFSIEQRLEQLTEIRKVTYKSVACGVMMGLSEAQQMCGVVDGGTRPLNLSSFQCRDSEKMLV